MVRQGLVREWMRHAARVGVACGWLVSLAVPASADPVLLSLKPKNSAADAKWELGRSALERGNLRQARTEFDASLSLEPRGIAPRIGLAEIALKEGDAARADGLIAAAVTASSQPADVYYVWGTFLHKFKRPLAAETTLKRAVISAPTHVLSRIALADLYMGALDKPADAARLYREVTQLDATHAGAQYGRGLALSRLGQYAEAEQALAAAQRLQPKNPLVPQALGRLQVARAKWPEAERAFGQAIQLLPTFARAYLDRGMVRAAQGNDTAALADFKAAAAHDASLVDAHVQLGALHQRRQDWPAAETAYRAALKVAPTSAPAMNNLAWMSAERGVMLDEALTWATKASSQEPRVAEYQVTLAWVHRARKDNARALDTLKRVAGHVPANARVSYYLGIVQLEAGDKAAGRASLQRALQATPAIPEADQARRLLAKAS